MLQFIFGKSGTGKTTLINNKIRELVSSNNNKIIMLVPDQSTFETEKTFLDLLGARKSKDVLVLGFSRLCQFVFEKTGNVPANVIDDGTRAVIMSIALEQLTEKLNLLKNYSGKSVAELMIQTLTDCKKNGITTDMLRSVVEKIEDETLKAKLSETALVLDTFDALVSQSYIDSLDDLTRLVNILSENNIFSGYTIFIDSFSGFTVQQLKVLRILMSQSKETYISLTLDPVSDGREDVFATSQQTYRVLKNIAKLDSIQIKPPVKLCDNRRFLNDELTALESGIFRNDYETLEKNPDNITMFAASNTYSECEFAARQIKRLVIENNYLYSDITVICHDIEPYRGILDEIFDKYEIPYFMDRNKDVEVKPVVRFVTSLFKMILNDFERDDVLSLLKTGLTGNSPDDISVFENYVFVWNINNSAFKSEFSQNPSGFADKFSNNDINYLKIAESVRKSVIEPATAFKSEIKDKNGREITKLLYELLCTMGVPEALKKMYDILESGKEKGLGAEQIRIWNSFMTVLDKMAAAIGDTYLSAKRYYELLTIQISAMELSDIPRTIDSVTVTTAQRVRLSKQKASFLIGCVDGSFPAVPHCSGIFSSFELKILSLNEISLSDDFNKIANLETFMAYSCMTSPSDKLFLSYPTADLLGNTFLPSVIMTETAKVFPDIITLDSADFDSPENSMWSARPAFEECAKSLSDNRQVLKDLYDYFVNDKKFSNKIKAVRRAVDSEPFKIENTKNAELLFGSSLRISASQIEKFSLCRFSYFCNYGLNIRKRRRAEINSLEYGTLVHYMLENFFTQYNKEQYSLMSDEEIENFADCTLDKYTEHYLGGKENKSSSFMYRLSALRQNVVLLLKHIVKELVQSEFYAADCELKIGSDIPAYTLKLPTGQNIAVCGSIDRVDLMESNGIKYLRVVDYKTNSKKFKLSDILYGLNLQMLLYLHSVEQNGKSRYGDIIPAGVLYMPATVPSISADKTTTGKQIENKLDSGLKMNGLLLDDITVIKGMDKSGKGTYIPVKIDFDTPVSDRSIATLEQFGKIFKKLDITAAQMGEALYGGQIQASPVKGAHDACEYCPYDSICSYRQSKPRNTFDVKNDVVFEKIEKELAERGE